MASLESIRTKQASADRRVQTAVAALAERSGIEVVRPTRLPSQVDAGYRTATITEALADTLERIAGHEPATVPDPEMDTIRATAVAALVAAGLAPEDAEIRADSVLIVAGLTDGDLESAAAAIVASPDPVADETVVIGGEDYFVETLNELRRDALNTLAATAGVPHPDRLPSKAAVIDAIRALAEPSDEEP